MPLDQAVLDWQVVGHSTGRERRAADRGGGRRGAARHGRAAARGDGRAGLRPVGIDLSAFGMIRALGADAPRRRDDFVAAPTVATRSASPAGRGSRARCTDDARRSLSPAQLYCNLGDVINLAVARGSACLFTRISPFGVEGIAQQLAERRQLTLEHARQWLVHVGLERSGRGDRGRRRDRRAPPARRSTEGAAQARRRAAALARVLRRAGGRHRRRRHRRLRPGDDDPGLVERLQRDLGHPFAVGRPRRSARLDAAAAARLTLSYGLALEELAVRPVNLIPPEQRRGERAPLAHRRRCRT